MAIISRFHRSVALFGPKLGLISSLLILAEECRQPNWDGYGAEPMSPRALRLAQDIIAALPECAIEPDGGVSLDWMPTPHRTLTVSVGESDRLPYAWVYGTDRGHAVAKLTDGQLPPRIVTEIRRFSSHALAIRAA